MISSPTPRPINYRLGLQRLYVVLAGFWFLAVSVVSARQWNDLAHVDFDSIAREYGATISSNPPEAIDLSELRPLELSDFKPLKQVPWVGRTFWLVRTMWAIGLPSTLYVLLFTIGPWVYRGFQASCG